MDEHVWTAPENAAAITRTVGERLAGRSCTAISSNTKGPRETGSPGAAKGFWKNGRILQTCRANS